MSKKISLKKRLFSLCLAAALLVSSLTFSLVNTSAESLSEYDLSKADELVGFMKTIPQLNEITSAYVFHYDNDEEYNAYKTFRENAIENASAAIEAYNSLSKTEKNNFNNIELSEGVDWNGVISKVAALGEYYSYDVDSSAGLVMPGANIKDSYNYQFSDDCYYFTSLHRGKHKEGNVTSTDVITAFLLINTDEYNNTTNPWKPNTKEYDPLNSNYKVAYCCDNDTYAIANHPYQMIDLEDSTYFEKSKANKIRSIVQNAYPFVSSDEMIDKLIENNVLTKKRAQTLDNGQLISGVQMAIWHYANGYNFEYNDTYSLRGKTYFSNELNPTIDYNLNTSGEKDNQNRTVVEANIEDIYQYLINLEPTVAKKKAIISAVDYEIFRVDGKTKAKIILNADVDKNDNITITATERGTSKNVVLQAVSGNQFEIDLSDFSQGKQIDVSVSGEQIVPDGVYFYQPYADVSNNKNERSSSQSFVGVSGGKTEVAVASSFKYDLSSVNTEVSLEKYAKINGQNTDIPVEGAEFELYKYNEDTQESIKISDFVTDENGRAGATVSDLKSDESLYVKEVKAANGYSINSDAEHINLKADDKGVFTAKVYNSGNTNLTINKVNHDGDLIDGAKFELKISDIPLGEYETGKNGDEKGVCSFKNLIPGKYTLTEVAAPTGFNSLNETIEFTISVKDGVTGISLDNEYDSAVINNEVITITNLRPHETENVDKVIDVTSDNVLPEQKEDLESALEDYNKALDENGDKYTDDEKNELENEKSRLQEAITSLEKVEQVETFIDNIPSTITPDDKDVITNALESFEELSDYEKSIVKSNSKIKLDNAVITLKGFEPENTPVVESTPIVDIPTAEVSLTPETENTPTATSTPEINDDNGVNENPSASVSPTTSSSNSTEPTPGTNATAAVEVTPVVDTTPTVDNDSSHDVKDSNYSEDNNDDNDGGEGSGVEQNNNDNPKTGDNNIPLMWIVLAFFSLLAIVVLSTLLISHKFSR